MKVLNTITVSANAVDLPAFAVTPRVHVASADTVASSIAIDAFGASPNITLRQAGGTNASKSATPTGTSIASFYGVGRGATAYSGNAAAVFLVATENWTDTANGTEIRLATTPIGSTTRGNSLVISDTAVVALGAISGSNLSGTNTGDQTFIAPAIGSITATGTSVTVDVTSKKVFRLTLQSNVTTMTLTGAVDGQKVLLEVIQDATGSRLITWPSNVAFGTDLTSITLTTTASKTDIIGLVYHAGTSKYRVLAFTKGF